MSTNVRSGVPWVNQHGVTGLVVEPGDVAALRRALTSLLEDGLARERMGVAAQHRVAASSRLRRWVSARRHCSRSGGAWLNASPTSPCPGSAWSFFTALVIAVRGHQTRRRRPGVLSTGPRGSRRSPVHRFEVPFDGPDAEAHTGPIQATAHDSRVTRIGHWMRKTAMDELPQLWNILCGDMSFVGPRALRPGEIEAEANSQLVRSKTCPASGHVAAACAPASPASRRSTPVAMCRAGTTSIRPHLRQTPLVVTRRAFDCPVILD